MAKLKTTKIKNIETTNIQMIMKWTDLMPGDILQYNPAYVEEMLVNPELYSDEKNHFKKSIGKKLKIMSVTTKIEDTINITFTDSNAWQWIINNKGLVVGGLGIFHSSIPIFEIIGLAKE